MFAPIRPRPMKPMRIWGSPCGQEPAPTGASLEHRPVAVQPPTPRGRRDDACAPQRSGAYALPMGRFPADAAAWPAPGPIRVRVLAVALPCVAVAVGAGVDRARACRLAVAGLGALALGSAQLVARSGRAVTGAEDGGGGGGPGAATAAPSRASPARPAPAI